MRPSLLRRQRRCRDDHGPEQQASQEADDQWPIQRLAHCVVSRADCDMRNLHGQKCPTQLGQFRPPLCLATIPRSASYLRIEERELEAGGLN